MTERGLAMRRFTGSRMTEGMNWLSSGEPGASGSSASECVAPGVGVEIVAAAAAAAAAVVVVDDVVVVVVAVADGVVGVAVAAVGGVGGGGEASDLMLPFIRTGWAMRKAWRTKSCLLPGWALPLDSGMPR